MPPPQSQHFCCCGQGHSRQIHPENNHAEKHGLIEIRPKRWLRICHINPLPRDKTFSQELHVAAQHHRDLHPARRRQQAVPKTSHVAQSQPRDVHLPNSVGDNAIFGERVFRHEILLRPSYHDSTSLQLDTNDRGHSAASVTLSLLSRQSCAPSPPTYPQGGTASVVKELKVQPHQNEEDVEKTNIAEASAAESSRDKEAVLFFIHGVGGCSDTWRAQLKYFAAQGYEIVAPDLIGHGFSMAPDKKKAYHFNEISKDLEVTFDRYCKRRNVIVAHSYGCSFAAILARKRSRRVTKIVLISGGGPIPLAPQPGIFSLPANILVCLRPCLNCGFQKNAFHRTSKVHGPKDQAFDIPTYVLSHTMNGQIWPEGDKVYHNWLSVATLLIHGKHDKLVTLEEEKVMEEAIYGAKLEVVDAASHMVMIEQPEIVNSLIHKFLLSGLKIKGQLDEMASPKASVHHSTTSLQSGKSVLSPK